VAVRPVMTIGNPVLRKVARDLTPEEVISDETRRLVEDMIDTMRHEEGIGIAAPQIGESLQVAVIEIQVDSDRYPDMKPFDLSVFVNPRITVLDEQEQGYWEGCLSVPNLRGLVLRPRQVRVDYYDLGGQKRAVVAGGFLATVFQHELDHLQGVLFVDRVRDTTKLATIEDYAKYWTGREGEQHMPD
jgi:peptide deformylase